MSTDAYGNDRLFAEARTRVNREDWGLTWNMAVELSGVLVAKEVDLEITVQAAAPPATNATATTRSAATAGLRPDDDGCAAARGRMGQTGTSGAGADPGGHRR